MPTASTGGEEGRANTPALRVPPGQIRIDINAVYDVVFSTADSVVTDRIIEARSETGPYGLGTMTYSCMGGYSFTVPGDWRSGDTIPERELTWTATRTDGGRVAAYGDAVFAPQVRAAAREIGGFNTTFGDVTGPRYTAGQRAPVDAAFQRVMTTCDCGLCQQERAETPEQTRRREAEERERYERARVASRERQAQKDAADARAEETLRMVLNPVELKCYEKTHQIIVTGADGRQYEIHPGVVSNVSLLNKRGKMEAVLCCHPDLSPGSNYRERLPDRDAHIAQILYLRHDLDKFWQTANVAWRDDVVRDKYFDEFPSRRTRSSSRNADGWGNW